MHLRLLELQQPDRVSMRVDEPGRQSEADVGNAVDGLQTGPVEFLDLDTADRRSATSAARSLTRQEALVWDSLVPEVLRVTTRRLSPPQRNVRKSSLSSRTSSPILS